MLPRLLAVAAARRGAPQASRRLLPAFCSPPRTAAAASTSGTAAPSPRRLGDILHLEKLAGATGAEIAAIWTDFHDATKKDATSTSASASASASTSSTPHAFRLGATLPADAYATFKARAGASPLLAFPVSKNEDGGDAGTNKKGASLTLLIQAQLPHLLIGTLGEYRDAGPAAPAHAVVTHYDDLADSKGIVLVRTDLISPHVLSPAEAARVVASIHSLYLDDGAGHAHARAFNHSPGEFDWEGLCRYLGVEVEAGGDGEAKG